MQEGKWFDPVTELEIPDPTKPQVAVSVGELVSESEKTVDAMVQSGSKQILQDAPQEGLKCKFCGKVYLFDKSKENQGRAVNQMAKHLQKEHANEIDKEKAK